MSNTRNHSNEGNGMSLVTLLRLCAHKTHNYGYSHVVAIRDGGFTVMSRRLALAANYQIVGG